MVSKQVPDELIPHIERASEYLNQVGMRHYSESKSLCKPPDSWLPVFGIFYQLTGEPLRSPQSQKSWLTDCKWSDMQWAMRGPRQHYDRIIKFDIMTIAEDNLNEVLKYIESFDYDILSDEGKDFQMVSSWKGWIREVL